MYEMQNIKAPSDPYFLRIIWILYKYTLDS